MAAAAVRLRWSGDGQRYEGGREDGPVIVIDSDGVAGPSPTMTLLLALAACMAVDVIEITAKMRLPVSGLEVDVAGERREEPPRRFTAIRLRYEVSGVAAADEAKIRRAVDLSREKYCSVWHTLKDDIDLTIAVELRGTREQA
jgi:putative redox protein